jgi:hypothetical protein
MLERTYVYADGEWVQWDEDKMKFLDVEEGVMGQDVITFEYEGKTYTSDARSG